MPEFCTVGRLALKAVTQIVPRMFVHWRCFYSLVPGRIVNTLPLVLRYGVEPPDVQMRDGVPCTRIYFDADRRMVAYAGLAALEDLRTTVNLVQLIGS